MVRNTIQKALPLIALMFVVVTARYAFAVKVPPCYTNKCRGLLGSACAGCCNTSCKDANESLDCQDACPLAIDTVGPDEPLIGL
jgi:hypothetical protein